MEKKRLEEEAQGEANIGALALKNFDRFGFSGGGIANNGFGNARQRQEQPLAR
jgi:hypothetical protein